MDRRGVAVRALAVFLATLAAQVVVRVPAQAYEASAEADFLARANALRAGVGAPPLAMDAGLTGVARNWSTQMAGGTGLAHNPSLRSLVDGLTSVWRKLGENVGEGNSVQQLHDALVASPHHYANLVDPDFHFVGIGVVVKNGVMWVTQDFLTGPTGAAPSTTTTTQALRPRPTTTTTIRRQPAPAAPTVAHPPAVPPAPPPVVAPPPPDPKRLRVALATEELLERALHLPVPSSARGRAR